MTQTGGRYSLDNMVWGRSDEKVYFKIRNLFYVLFEEAVYFQMYFIFSVCFFVKKAEIEHKLFSRKSRWGVEVVGWLIGGFGRNTST